MKNLFVLLSLVFAVNAHAQSHTNMRSLESYMKQEDTSDMAIKEYILMRCAANYQFTAVALLKGGREDSAQKTIEISSNLALAASVARQIYNMNKGIIQSEVDISNEVSDLVSKTLKRYINDANEHYIASGNHMIGSYIEKDMEICKGTYENIQDFLMP